MRIVEWEWQEHYLAAFLETNSLKLAERVATAEKAIFWRRKEIRGNLGGPEERQAIADAISGLSVIKGEIQSNLRRVV